MADESIVIEIKDNIQGSISTKIRAIATDANAADNAIKILQKQLDSLNVDKLKNIGTSASSAATALNKITLANQNLATAEERTAKAATNVAIAQAKASVASDKTALSALKLAEAHQRATDKVQASQQAEISAATAQKALNDEVARGIKIEADYAAMLARQAAEQNSAIKAASNATSSQGSRNSSPISSLSNVSNLNPAPIKDYRDELSKLLGQIDPTVAALDRLDVQEKKLTGFKKNGTLDTDTFNDYKSKLDQAREALGKFDNGTGKVTMSAKQLRQATLYLPAQFGDLARQIAAGGSPMTAIFQQGSQLTNMFGGLGAALKATGSYFLTILKNPIVYAIAAVVALVASLAKLESKLREVNGLTAQFSATGRGNLDQSFVVQLKKEIAELPGVSKSAAASIIQEFASVRTIGGKNIQDASKLVADFAAATGQDAPAAAKELARSLEDPIKGVLELDKKLGLFTIKNMEAIKSLSDAGKTAQAQALIINLLSKAIGGLANESMTPLQKATNELGNAWNRFSGELENKGPLKAITDLIATLFTKMAGLLDTLASFKMPPWLEKMFSGGLNGLVTDALKPDDAGGATGSLAENKRTGPQYQQTTTFKGKASGITDKKVENAAKARALALAKINEQLDNQIERYGMLQPAYDKQQMFDTIEEGLIGRKITLNDKEENSIRSKIAAIVDGTAQQEQFNRIYEESIAPLRDYENSSAAINTLLANNAISESEANKQRLEAFQIYEKINAPLNEYFQTLEDSKDLMKYYGSELEQQTEQQRIINELLAKNIALRGDVLQPLFDNVKVTRELNESHKTENQLILDSVGKREEYIRQLTAINKLKNDPKSGFTAGDAAKATNDSLTSSGFDTSLLKIGVDAQTAIYQEMYDKIKLMRDANSINEQDAAALTSQVKAKELDLQTAQAQNYFTGLAVLSKSSNKALSAIGKAAAISNALIDTYKSATGAYASLASIPIVGPALGAAAAGAAIAAGLANVQAIRSQGFMAGGYTGDMPTNAVAGAVHGKEYVFDAASTARIGVDNLNAMRLNSGNVGTNQNSKPTINQNNNSTKIINVLDPAIVGDYLKTSEGEQLIINTVRNNPDSIRAGQNV